MRHYIGGSLLRGFDGRHFSEMLAGFPDGVLIPLDDDRDVSRYQQVDVVVLASLKDYFLAL
jgi:hypothetical protein